VVLCVIGIRKLFEVRFQNDLQFVFVYSLLYLKSFSKFRHKKKVYNIFNRASILTFIIETIVTSKFTTLKTYKVFKYNEI